MTEQEWLNGGDKEELANMLKFLRGKASNRKLRLFACNCSRYGKDFSTNLHTQNVIGVAERFADGLASAAERDSALNDWPLGDFQEITPQGFAPTAAAAALWPDAHEGAQLASDWATMDIYGNLVTYPGVSDDLANHLRDIFGNPFRAVKLDSAWLTENVVQIAQTVYAERAFDRLPILADALEDAGCDNADILNHCRQPGEHVRGCWCLDLLLGKG